MTSFLASHWNLLRLIPIYLYGICMALFSLAAKSVGWDSVAKGVWIGAATMVVLWVVFF